MPYTFADFRTRRPVIWAGPSADAWFRDGPGVIETDEAPTCCDSPIDAAYSVCADPHDWRDAETIIERLRDYLCEVALAALTGNARAREIVSRALIGWNVVEAGSEGMSRLRLLNIRIADAEAAWRQEVERLQQIASADVLAAAIVPMQCELAIGWITGRHALIYWRADQPPLPVELPFLRLPDPEPLLKPGAYRLAVAQVLAAREGRTLSRGNDPCAEAWDTLTLTAHERRLLWWARQLYPLHCAPDFSPRMLDRAAEIWREVSRTLRGADA